MSSHGNPPPKLATRAGDRHPLGATQYDDGVNFAIFSPRATRMWLRLYRAAADLSPIVELALDAAVHSTNGFRHVYVVGAPAGGG